LTVRLNFIVLALYILVSFTSPGVAEELAKSLFGKQIFGTK